MASQVSYQEIKRLIGEWTDQNPLRVWRAKAGLTQDQVAPMIGKSWMAINKWENGSNLPRDSSMARLVELTGNKNLPDEWERWYKRCPRPDTIKEDAVGGTGA